MKTLSNFVRWSLLAACLAAQNGSSATESYRFSHDFSTGEILTNAARRDEFVQKLMVSLGSGFHQPGTAYHPTLGTTFDGARFDFFSGRPFGVRKSITVGSKEAVHLSILAACIASNHPARLFVSPADTNAASLVATNLIIRKLNAWDEFDQRFPGFGKWLPWMVYAQDKLWPALNPDNPLQTWTNRLPSLDNGEWAVALLQIEGDLRNAGFTNLAERVWSRLTDMRTHAVRIFIEPTTNLVRGVVHIAHPELSPTNPAQLYTNDILEGGYFANDAYEGEMIALFLDLFGEWPNPANREALWQKRRTATNFVVGETNITVQVGYRFSAHEDWGFLQWPYLDIPRASNTFYNGQVARTYFSATNGIPGLFAAAHRPLTGNEELRYDGRPGIPALAQPSEQTNTVVDMVSAYGSFPLMLVDRRIGLAWLDIMLDGAKAQSASGIADSLSTDGSAVAPLVTWDVNGLAALSVIVASRVAGTGEHPLKQHLVRHGVYSRASMLISNEYAEAFPSVEATGLSLAPPTATVPLLLPDFPASNAPPPGNILAGTPFKGTLSNAFNFTNGVLTLVASNGFLYTECERFRLEAVPWLHLRVRGEGRLNVELKNANDERMGHKFSIEIPDTGSVSESFYGAFPSNVFSFAEDVSLVAISDPSGHLEISAFEFTGSQPTNAHRLEWDGVGFVQDPLKPIELLTESTTFLGDTNSQLTRDHTFTNGLLVLPPVPGFLFEFTPLLSVATKPILTLRAKTTGCRIFIEIKDTDDELMTFRKVAIEIPNTTGSYREFSMNIGGLVRTANSVLNVFVFSDPQGAQLQLSSTRFSPTMPVGTTELYWDGVAFVQYPQEPVELLSLSTTFLGSTNDNALFDDFSFTGGTLTLPSVPGFVFQFTAPVSLTSKAVLTLRARTAGTRIFVEVKNTDDQLMTPQKVLVEIPNTEGAFREFSMNFRSPIESSNTILYVFALSDPGGSGLEVNSMRFSPAVPNGSAELQWDGRRFTERLAPTMPPLPFVNFLEYLNFIIGPGFSFVQDGDLRLQPSAGFAYTLLPPQVRGQPLAFRITEKPVFCLVVATFSTASSRIFLEFKNATNGTLFGEGDARYSKLQLVLPKTAGVPRLVRYDLTRYLTNMIEPKDLRVIALSDPSGGEIHIAALGFSSSAPTESRLAKIGGDRTNPWITWYGGWIADARAVDGPWTTNTVTSPWYPTNNAPLRFWRVVDNP
jgi:hypothetical protein